MYVSLWQINCLLLLLLLIALSDLLYFRIPNFFVFEGCALGMYFRILESGAAGAIAGAAGAILILGIGILWTVVTGVVGKKKKG